jgi:hypothetical protein
VHLDDEGYLNLDLPWDSNDQKFREFDRWKKTCCPHEWTDYARERISNWSGYRLFQQRLAEIGWQHFPVLQAELPEANGGLTDAKAAAAALEELAFLESTAHSGQDVVLMDLSDGEMLYRYIEAYQGIFTWCGKSGMDLGVDPNGFFVRLREDKGAPGVDLFRSKQFEQEHIRENEIIFRDVETGEVFRGACGVTRVASWPDGRLQNDEGRVNQIYPKHLQVEMKPRTSADLDYIIQPLKRIFGASVETGNPVRWC